MSDVIYRQYLTAFDALRRAMQSDPRVAVDDALAGLRSTLGRKLSQIAERDAAHTASPKTRLELLLELLDPQTA